MTKLSRSLVLGCSIMALAACGPEEIASPGTGGNITINNPAPTPTPTPTPTGGTVTAANGCPTIADAQGLTDDGITRFYLLSDEGIDLGCLQGRRVCVVGIRQEIPGSNQSVLRVGSIEPLD